MSTVTLELDADLVAILREQDQPLERAARDLMVMELYRRHAISRGKAASLLGMPFLDFVRYAGSLGIPYFDMTLEEWDAELKRIEAM